MGQGYRGHDVVTTRHQVERRVLRTEYGAKGMRETGF